MSTASSSPILVTLVYACHECEETKLERRNLRSHLQTVHSIELPTLKRGQRLHNSLQYFFVKSTTQEAHQAISQRFACPSCLYHFATIDEYKLHVISHIDPDNTESVALPQKRKNGGLYRLSKSIQPRNSANFPQEYAAKLEPLVIFEQNGTKTTNICTLKQFVLLEQLLKQALTQEVDNLPTFVWSSQIVADPDEQKMINVMKFVLTSFANTCSPIGINTRPCQDYERTFWIQHIAPILQTFANQTGLLSFNWCEVPIKINPTENQDAPLYVDAMGYDWRRNERLVFEASSGQYTADPEKVIDDRTKLVSSMMSMLKEVASSHPNAQFETLLETKIFGIQSIKTNIVLSEIIFGEDGRCRYSEVRSAEVPTEYNERNKWIKIFDILCYLFVEMNKQKVHYQVIEDQEQGAIIVLPEDTVSNKLCPNN